MTNILIVDDERMVQQLFTYYIENASDRYRIAGVVKDAGNAEILCAKEHIDLILMDICTANESSGIVAAEAIKRSFPKIKIIIVTSAPDYRFIEKARAAKADSFWYKEVSDQELIDVIDRTMAGKSIYPDTTPVVDLGTAKSVDFSARELELLSNLLTNKSLHEIAKQMGISYATARTYVERLKEKTGARNIVELCYLATKSRLILPEY